MEKIKCPYCGQYVNEDVRFCPNCGSSLVEYKNNLKADSNMEAPAPKDPVWIEKWKTKCNLWRFVWLTIFLFFAISTLIHLPLLINKDISDVGRLVYGAICTWITVFVGPFMIWGIVVLKVKVINVEGYNVVVTCGLSYTVIVEDVIQVKKDNESGGIFHRRYLPEITAFLPNNKKIFISCPSAFAMPEVRFEGEKKDF